MLRGQVGSTAWRAFREGAAAVTRDSFTTPIVTCSRTNPTDTARDGALAENMQVSRSNPATGLESQCWLTSYCSAGTQQCGESHNICVIAHKNQNNDLESLKVTRITSKIKHDSLLWPFTSGIIKDLLARRFYRECFQKHVPEQSLSSWTSF